MPDWGLSSAVIGAQRAWPGAYQVRVGTVPTYYSLASAYETPPPFTPCPWWFATCTFPPYYQGAQFPYTWVAGVNFVSTNPPFDGVFGTPFAGDAQTHPSPPGVNASAGELTQALDDVVENGESEAPNFALVSGQLYRYRPGVVTDADDFYSNGSGSGCTPSPACEGTPASGGIGAAYINRKIMATAASCGDCVLKDVSGPSSSIGNTVSDSYKYCVARVANECVSGSLPGDIYVNCPGITQPGTGPSSPPEVGCRQGSAHGGPPFGVGKDMCIQNIAKAANSVIQYTLQASDYYGANTRTLASATSRLNMVYNFENASALPDNSWIMYVHEFLNLDRSDIWMLQYPPYPAVDSVNRGTFIPITVPTFTPPGGTNNTVADFGYWEYSQGGTPYCTTRLDACEATGTSIPSGYQPFKFASETPFGPPCSSGCTLVIPAISQRELYYRLRYQNSGGGTNSVGPWVVVSVP